MSNIIGNEEFELAIGGGFINVYVDFTIIKGSPSSDPDGIGGQHLQPPTDVEVEIDQVRVLSSVDVPDVDSLDLESIVLEEWGVWIIENYNN